MSPNEFQLRSALRDGEGEHVDPDTVIARARGTLQARHDRRVRYGSVAAIVAVVGGIGVAGGIALRGGGHNTAASGGSKQSTTDRAVGAAGGQVNGAENLPGVPGPQANALAVACPATVPQFTSAGPPRDGTGSLFSGPVESMRLCAYQQQGGAPIVGPDGNQVSTVLTGQQATGLAASLDAAPKTKPKNPCPLYLSAAGKTLVIIGLSTTGQAMKPITVTVAQNPCGLPVTNGTAIRYDWSPPKSLDHFIAQLRPADTPGIAPSGKVTAAPIQS